MSETVGVGGPNVGGARSPSGRNLVLCLDGTTNEPEKPWTNVVRLYSVLQRDDRQLIHYDPGVGTMGSRGAWTRLGRFFSKLGQMAMGHGIKDNVEEAYGWLVDTYEPGDRIFVFGFSRGAYTARAVTGMLATVGLLRPSARNLVPYAVKLWAKTPPDEASPKRKAYWDTTRRFTRTFGRPTAEFTTRFETVERQVRFLGVWDTVKTAGVFGWAGWRPGFVQARWPYTRDLVNVTTARHAMALGERRFHFPVSRFAADSAPTPAVLKDGTPVVAPGPLPRLQEVWFAGTHGDVGGDAEVADIALDWMVREAVAAGLLVDARKYREAIGVARERGGPDLPPLPRERWSAPLHANSAVWWVLGGFRWGTRVVLDGDDVHESVLARRDATAGLPGSQRYAPRLPELIEVVRTR
ncbi:DUF2235 domain-containing protein [Miniimonas arenae]|uniref:DUF2235 domain-containing protein n=1 Tax=Miniimonas arenae TaxID=676201 RepID=A0A5C5B8S5_9MICO|nr:MULTISPECIES: DUF2235 domain-containing protein [Miniimonas]TNU73373.1 DUF2235 domain-containing protein [Miniimonas arenae]